MTDKLPARCYRFGVFEADPTTGELRRKGIRIKLHSQPFQILVLLLERPGELLTREEICRHLWPEGTFIDYDHGVNSAVNRLREALGDKANSPRYVETLARRGYRLLAPVERVGLDGDALPTLSPDVVTRPVDDPTAIAEAQAPDRLLDRILANQGDLPKASHSVVQTLFILLQLMYIGFYVGSLSNLTEINQLFAQLLLAGWIFPTLIVTAVLLIPVRTFLLCAVLFHAPGMKERFMKMWPYLLVGDWLWALSPFLLLHHINYGFALACVPPLIYSPFAQRSLILMGAGTADQDPTPVE